VTDATYSDDPISTLKEDRLGRDEYVKYVSRVLERVRDRGTSSTVIGVIGPWGSGKSSVAGLVAKGMSTEWQHARFEPWGYGNLDSMLQGFFEELRRALPKGRKWSQKRKAIGGVGRALSPLGAVGAVAGVDGSGMLKEVAGWIEGDTSPTAVLKAAAKIMEGLEKPVLVTVDDLDRLSPDELLMVFKLVRFLGRLPNVYYLLCYDEQTLLEVLRRTDLASGSVRRAQDYLEKMIQVRLDLPPVREQDAEDLLNQSLAEIFEAHQIVLSRDAVDRLGEGYRNAMRHSLTTPRAIGRFGAQLDAFMSALESDFDTCDFVLLTWIRTFEPRLYELIHRSRAELTNSVTFDLIGETLPEAKARWYSQLKALDLEDQQIERIASLLGSLFIPIRSAWSNSQYDSSFYDDLAAEKRVGHKDYFDRYFAFSITHDDISDQEVDAAFTKTLAAGEERDRSRLTRLLSSDPAKVARKLSAAIANGRVDPAEVVRYVVANSQETAERTTSEGPAPLSWVLREAFLRIPAEEGPVLVSEVCDGLRTIVMTADAVSREKNKQETQQLTGAEQWDWMAAAVEAVNLAIEGWLGDPDDDLREGAQPIFGLWRWISPASCQMWLRAHAIKRDLLSVISDVLYSKSGEDGERLIHPLTAETLDVYFGLDFVTEHLPATLDLETAQALDPAGFDDWYIDTPDAREALASASLKRALLN
jgi:predicted KAP-like P-loop ATPase